MTSVVGTFTNVGISPQMVVNNNRRISYDIAGTFSGMIELQRSNRGLAGWETLKVFSAPATGEILIEDSARFEPRLRFACTEFISGPISYRADEIAPPIPADSEVLNDLQTQLAAALDQLTFLSSVAGDAQHAAEVALQEANAALADVRADLADCQSAAPFGISTALQPYNWTVNGWVKPDALIPLDETPALTLKACPGETFSADFIAWSSSDQADLTLDIDFDDEGITIDPWIVKNWFTSSDWIQLGPTYVNRTNLLPELLLKNEGLVRTDNLALDNYMVVSRSGTPTEVKISVRERNLDTNRAAVYFPPGFLSTDVVDDAATLQPFDLDRGRNKQIWLTITIPDDATPGTYTGSIAVKNSNDDTLGSVAVSIQVLDIDLLADDKVRGVYYRGQLNASRSLASDRKNEAQMRADLQLMVDHGINHLIAYFPTAWVNSNTNPSTIDPLLPAQIALFAEYGFLDDWIGVNSFSLYGVTWSSTTVRALQEFGALLRASNPALKVYWYLKDEPVGDILKQEIDSGGPVDRVHALNNSGGLDYVISAAKLSNHLPRSLLGQDQFVLTDNTTGHNFPVALAAGDWRAPLPNATSISWLDEAVVSKWDAPIFSYQPVPLASQIYHAAGKPVYSYNNPQTGTQNPRRFRLNYGARLWAANYDGSFIYAYQDAFHAAYNPWDNTANRDHMLVYPGTSKPLNTIMLQGVRDGIVDYRYLRTLDAKIAAASAGAAKTAAQAYVTQLRADLLPSLASYPDKKRTPDDGFDVEAMRANIATHILALS